LATYSDIQALARSFRARASTVAAFAAWCRAVIAARYYYYGIIIVLKSPSWHHCSDMIILAHLCSGDTILASSF
jgi:hypothetical protein